MQKNTNAIETDMKLSIWPSNTSQSLGHYVQCGFIDATYMLSL